jgi:hypothetical protein
MPKPGWMILLHNLLHSSSTSHRCSWSVFGHETFLCISCLTRYLQLPQYCLPVFRRSSNQFSMCTNWHSFVLYVLGTAHHCSRITVLRICKKRITAATSCCFIGLVYLWSGLLSTQNSTQDAAYVFLFSSLPTYIFCDTEDTKAVLHTVFRTG